MINLATFRTALDGAPIVPVLTVEDDRMPRRSQRRLWLAVCAAQR